MQLFVTKARLDRLVTAALEALVARQNVDAKEHEQDDARAKERLESFKKLKPYVPGESCRMCGAAGPTPRLVDGIKEVRINECTSVSGLGTPTYGYRNALPGGPRCYLAVVCLACGGVDHRATVDETEHETKKPTKDARHRAFEDGIKLFCKQAGIDYADLAELTGQTTETLSRALVKALMVSLDAGPKRKVKQKSKKKAAKKQAKKKSRAARRA